MLPALSMHLRQTLWQSSMHEPKQCSPWVRLKIDFHGGTIGLQGRKQSIGRFPPPCEGDPARWRHFNENADGDIVLAHLDTKRAARFGFQNMRDAEPLRHELWVNQKREDRLRVGLDDDGEFDCDRLRAHGFLRFCFCARSAAALSFPMRPPQNTSSSARRPSITSRLAW